MSRLCRRFWIVWAHTMSATLMFLMTTSSLAKNDQRSGCAGFRERIQIGTIVLVSRDGCTSLDPDLLNECLARPSAEHPLQGGVHPCGV